ncbi:T cell receptor gamma 2, partial [Clarias magur]
AKKEKPKVSVFPVSRDQGKGKHVLLCHARDMFPNIVKFRWEDSNAQPVQASQAGYDLLEQTDDQEKRITSMLIVDKSIIKAPYKYKCFVKHETDEKEEQSFSIPTDQPAGATSCSQGGQDDPQDGDLIS